VAYGGSYVSLAHHYQISDRCRVREYDSAWMTVLFAPAARLESFVTGDDVNLAAEHVGPDPNEVCDHLPRD
jgi:hypothetical protein